MADLVNSSEEEAVILDKASSTPKKVQVNARVHWFFTFNNYDSEDITILLKVFNELCYMYAFQEETGENGTKHLQGIISLKRRARWSEFGLQREIHWEKPNNVKDCYIYCTKEKTRTGNVFLLKYEIPYHYKLDCFFDWQQELLDIISQPPDDRVVHWYWSDEGSVGKSCFVKHLLMNNNAILCTKGKYNDICNLIYNAKLNKSKNIVLFDLPRNNGNAISYDAIESIKNGMISNMKYETGFVIFPPPHVIVFANEPPERSKLSKDRWHVREIF